mmetsp:Transcript_69790/g.160417  ORF Transcript_69790/g.160417 Transcript_69790/m.160417 type:complete len:282 (+) Transcript_69790:710-1555(+)
MHQMLAVGLCRMFWSGQLAACGEIDSWVSAVDTVGILHHRSAKPRQVRHPEVELTHAAVAMQQPGVVGSHLAKRAARCLAGLKDRGAQNIPRLGAQPFFHLLVDQNTQRLIRTQLLSALDQGMALRTEAYGLSVADKHWVQNLGSHVVGAKKMQVGNTTATHVRQQALLSDGLQTHARAPGLFPDLPLIPHQNFALRINYRGGSVHHNSHIVLVQAEAIILSHEFMNSVEIMLVGNDKQRNGRHSESPFDLELQTRCQMLQSPQALTQELHDTFLTQHPKI